MPVLIRAISYLLIPLFYLALGWVNLSQAGKNGLLGALAVAAVSAWTLRNGRESRAGRSAVLLTVSLFVLILGFQGFLRSLFGVAQDDNLVIEAIFNTDSAEAGEFFLQNVIDLLFHVAVALVAIGLFAFVLNRLSLWFQTPSLNRLRRLATILVLLFAALHLNPTLRKENPLLFFPIRYAKWKNNLEQMRALKTRIDRSVANDSLLSSMQTSAAGPRTVVFVLGESTTRLNWSLYGYPRPTTPQLEKLGGSLLHFNDVVTTDGSTILDIEKILTPATRLEPKRFETAPDLLTMARQAGYKTFWITNHGTDLSGVLAIFSGNADTTVNANRGRSRGEGSYDEVVLPPLEAALTDPAPRKLIIVHLLGGHPAYYYRYPDTFARFNNSADSVSRALEADGRAFYAVNMRNYYDNAMLYADHVLRRSIALCEEKSPVPTAWIFAPDHGEDVAHYTNFSGHNTRVPAMFEIPLLYWQSRDFPPLRVDPASLTRRPYQTDQLDQALLGLMGITGGYYDPRRDLFSDRFEPLPRVVAGNEYPHAAPLLGQKCSATAGPAL